MLSYPSIATFKLQISIKLTYTFFNSIVLLTNQSLICSSSLVQFIFKRDLIFCPTFSKLKTLLLFGWSVAVDPSSVVFLLQHSPVLEKLTLQLYKVPEGSQNPEHHYAFAHLKIVEGERREVEESAQNFLKSHYGIPVDLIKIQEPNGSSYSSCWRADNYIDKEEDRPSLVYPTNNYVDENDDDIYFLGHLFPW
ncbi:hypothetical protein SEVIR_8G069101v4 [Setaria viridis]|nr:uncharacterized protein LOC117866350 [Setaria viridis]